MSDPLSDVLSLVAARSVLSAGLSAGGAWSVRVAGYEGLKFNAVVQGRAWLIVEGGGAPSLLQAGDCFMLAQGAPFILTSDPALPSCDADHVFAKVEGGVARIGGGQDFLALGGKMVLDGRSEQLLIDALPPMVVLTAGSDAAATVRWLLERFIREARSHEPGSRSQATLAMQMMFIELMRACLASKDAAPKGWLGALADERIGKALHAMHGDPSHDWRLPDLARIANLSRSGFALRFKTAVGVSPIDYLLRWRMHLAARALRQQRQSLSSIAHSAGYASESAFGSAFKRVFGSAPRTFISRRNASSET